MKTAERIIWPDLLRIFAIFGVVLNHVISFDTNIKSYDWQIANIFFSIVRFNVPVFIMISGMFNLNFMENSIFDFNAEIKKMSKKLLRIVSALIFWSILNIITPLLFKMATTGVPSSVFLSEILKIPYKILSCEPWSHLWYLYLITGLYLITPLIKIFLQQAKKEHLKYYLVLYFIFGLCIPFYNSLNDFFNNFMSFFPNKIYFPFSELTGFLGYYIAGYYFSKYNIRSKYRIIIGIFALFSIAITISGTYLISLYRGRLDLNFYVYPTPTIMFLSFFVFLLFKNFASKLKFTTGQQKIIQHISRCTFGIYLSHWTILNFLNEIGLNTKIMNGVISIPLLTLFIIICSYAVTVIIQRIPLLKTYVI